MASRFSSPHPALKFGAHIASSSLMRELPGSTSKEKKAHVALRHCGLTAHWESPVLGWPQWVPVGSSPVLRALPVRSPGGPCALDSHSHSCVRIGIHSGKGQSRLLRWLQRWRVGLRLALTGTVWQVRYSGCPGHSDSGTALLMFNLLA